MHPVGPLPPRVYWLRRVIILVVAVIVLLGLVYLVVGRQSTSGTTSGESSSSSSSVRPSMTGVLASTSASSSPSSSASTEEDEPSSSPEPEPTPSTPSTSSAPSPTASAAEPSPAEAPSESVPSESVPVEPPPPATSEEPAPPPERQKDADGRDLCFDNEIGLTAIASGPFAFGQQPVIGMRVQNIGTVPCTRDVSASLQVFTVIGADGSHIWSTTDCFPGQGTEVRTLAPGETLEYQVKWSGTTSQPGCTGDRLAVPAGDYMLVAALSAVQSPPTVFQITG